MNFAYAKPTTVTLRNVNLRAEKHGDENEPAIDLKFTRTAPNTELGLLSDKLLDAMYWRAEHTEDQGEIEGVDKIAPNLRLPQIESFSWTLELTGCRVEIDYGLGKKSNIVLTDCKVNALRVLCKEGGTVEITFRVQTSHFPEGALDKLAGKLDQETAITLEVPEQDDLSDDENDSPPAPPAEKKGKGARKDATQAFLDEQT
jgi:hypothetical protein